MKKNNKIQKIIIGVILCIISIVCLYYIYTQNDNEVILSKEITNDNNIDENIETEKMNEEKEKEKPKIIVHISGAVNKEGIVELEENSRILDAINKADGLKENADIKDINLAFKLEDGMKIYIPQIDEKINSTLLNKEKNEIDKTTEYVETYSEGIRYSANNNKKEKININKANQTELETLPGIGPSTSLKIINYRKENGKFNSIEEIKDISGIGTVKYEKIKDLICI